MLLLGVLILFGACKRADKRKVFNDTDKKNFAQDSALYHQLVVEEKENFKRLNYLKDSTGIFVLPVEDSLKQGFSQMLSELKKDSLGLSEPFLVKRKVSRRITEIQLAVSSEVDTSICLKGESLWKSEGVYRHKRKDQSLVNVLVLKKDSTSSSCSHKLWENEALKTFNEIKKLQNNIKLSRDEKNYMYQVWGGKFR